MGMTGLGVTVRLLSDCSRGVVAASDVDAEVPAVGFEALSGELLISSGSQRTAAKESRKETKNKTITPIIQTLAFAIIGSGDIVWPKP
jgi:hypothetical protein